jgi:pre-mRNA cleavage complex 2 protein Pcf11
MFHGYADSSFPFCRFDQVPPWMKLPAWYLLDAISKNVHEPYARVFASFVIPLFLETYRVVDGPTRSKMDEMLLTWRTGSPAQKELFGLAPQLAIERGIWGDQAVSCSRYIKST